jgi:Protein of unknown function (DUF2911)
MNKFLKWTAITVGVLAVLLFVAILFVQSQPKASPEDTATYDSGAANLSVSYCRPYKKGREIFGKLVPFGQVWRTGANEATTFTTTKDLTIGGKALPAGKYTLWTIPEKDQWTVIFNKKQYFWGVNFSSVASREPEADVLQIQVPVEILSAPVEQFTISFDKQAQLALVLVWDNVKVAVPINE